MQPHSAQKKYWTGPWKHHLMNLERYFSSPQNVSKFCSSRTTAGTRLAFTMSSMSWNVQPRISSRTQVALQKTDQYTHYNISFRHNLKMCKNGYLHMTWARNVSWSHGWKKLCVPCPRPQLFKQCLVGAVQYDKVFKKLPELWPGKKLDQLHEVSKKVLRSITIAR